MTKTKIPSHFTTPLPKRITTVAIGLLLVSLAGGCQPSDSLEGTEGVSIDRTSPSTTASDQGLLYGRVTTDAGGVYEGRLRWGGDEEALWSNYFNGVKKENPWAEHVPVGERPTERRGLEVLGREVIGWDRAANLERPFMARFGDLRLIEPRGQNLRVTLKSGTVFTLDRFAADDLADGLRVWDSERGVVDLDEWKIESIEFRATPEIRAGSVPLYGTVYTQRGNFTGLLQWNRESALADDELHGSTDDGETTVKFDRIRSIARHSEASSTITTVDGEELVLSGTRAVGHENRGVYVDDPRFGRVLVSWDVFERVAFSAPSPAPAYSDFGPGRALTGTVATKSGASYSGTLVFDLDESETTETLDAPSEGVDYTISFARIVSIDLDPRGDSELQKVHLVLGNGEDLFLERAGDLGDDNLGLLIFGDDGTTVYVAWAEVGRIDLDGGK